MSDVTTPSGPPAVEGAEERAVDEVLAQELVERARTEGVELVRPGGLLTGLTKTVLETALGAELDQHLGYSKHAVEGRNSGDSRNGTRSKTVLRRCGTCVGSTEDVIEAADAVAAEEQAIEAWKALRPDLTFAPFLTTPA